jgi:hypothetical protein
MRMLDIYNARGFTLKSGAYRLLVAISARGVLALKRRKGIWAEDGNNVDGCRAAIVGGIAHRATTVLLRQTGCRHFSSLLPYVSLFTFLLCVFLLRISPAR